MVTGGSQGAQAINEAVSAAAPQLRAAGVQVLHIAGPKNDVEVAPGTPPYVVLPYVDSMQYAYAAADFVICRSGAMTCAELTAVGLPAAYVPLPLRGGEQRTNAEPIVAAGGGVMVDNADLTPQWIVREVIPRVSDPQRLQAMATAASSSGARDADVVLARAVLDIIEKDAS
jgi:UDP-N-acetylglucosamine--N-acetylmuramyl-(pentapeptide) pyrophosphoryl-undecaprenol N-acetylglucosamine transferase